ncbi:UNKNOWN [Stylonychia lemnae]|uniref:DUF4200 domain-containing protein n=1 Tax=Stylonychia lemnae TaxID=5949 RepID=A0A078A3F4_STYLE|nr:UNKNOWN [Stylonychia lemnae]|eukprot:CDW76813.1 UNKNOWN [Stylonychia lemnae]
MFQSVMNSTGSIGNNRQKSQEDIRFESKIEREMRLADKRVLILQEKIGNTLNMHQGSFSKYFEQISNAQNPISNKSFSKLMKNQAIAEAEPMLKKVEEEVKLKRVEEVDEGIDREEFNCEISEHILERNREEAILVKEKVKEIQKVVLELDKKIKNAQILETYAVHQKEEALTQYQEYLTKMQKMKEQQKDHKQEMAQKCKEIEKIIESKKDVQKNRERSQDIIKKRAERLKKSIEKLRERESRFQKIAQNQKNENDRFISQFENLCSNFQTEKPDEINHKYIQKTLENQSIVNWFNDLAKHIFDLKMKKEELQKELQLYISNNDFMLTQNNTLRYDKGEYHEKKIENKIIQNKQRSSKLTDLLKFKKESVLSVINGLKHLARKLQADGDVNQSIVKYENQPKFEVADINFPEIIGTCSQISMLVEKKFSYQMQFNEQFFGYKVVLFKGRDRNTRYQTVVQLRQFFLLNLIRTLIYGQGGVESLRKIYEEYKRVSQKKGKSTNLMLVEKRSSVQDSQNGEEMGQSENEDNNSFLDDGSGFVSENNAGDLENELSIEKDGLIQAKETIQLGKNFVVKKHNLSTVQESEEHPFSKKMDMALQFIDDMHDKVIQFENFNHSLDQSEIEIHNNLEEKRREQKNRLLFPQQDADQNRAKTAAAGSFKNQILSMNETFNSTSSLNGGQSHTYRQKLALRKQRELAAANGFFNKGISDFGFINMICETNKEFKIVDTRLHKLRIQRLGKSSSLPTLELKKISIQQHQATNNNSILHSAHKSNKKPRKEDVKHIYQIKNVQVQSNDQKDKGDFNSKLGSPIVLRPQILRNAFSQSAQNLNIDGQMRKFMNKRAVNADEFLQVYKKKVEDFKKSQKEQKRELNKKQKMLLN